jgi:hypothetical protein
MDQAQTPWLILPFNVKGFVSFQSRDVRVPAAAPPRIIFLNEDLLPESNDMVVWD